MFEVDKTIMGSKTSFDIDLSCKERLVYNYELKKRLLKVYVYGNLLTISKNDMLGLNLKTKLKKYNDELFIIDKKILDNYLKSNSDIEIEYIKE